MSDVRAMETDQNDSDIYVKVVWGLYVATILLGLTHIVGVILAYIWRGNAPVGSLYRGHFDGQIRLFWRTFLLGLASGVLYFLLVVVTGVVTSGSFGFEVQFGVFTAIFYIIIIVLYFYFVIMSIIGLIKSIKNRPYS